LRDWGRKKLAVRNLELSDQAGVRSSVVSGGNRDSIIVRTDLLTEQANARGDEARSPARGAEEGVRR
jgi:hypothetical protein